MILEKERPIYPYTKETFVSNHRWVEQISRNLYIYQYVIFLLVKRVTAHLLNKNLEAKMP